MNRLLRALAAAYNRASERTWDEALEGPCGCHDDDPRALCPDHDKGWRTA